MDLIRRIEPPGVLSGFRSRRILPAWYCFEPEIVRYVSRVEGHQVTTTCAPLERVDKIIMKDILYDRGYTARSDPKGPAPAFFFRAQSSVGVRMVPAGAKE